jgi:hypothetical protein
MYDMNINVSNGGESVISFDGVKFVKVGSMLIVDMDEHNMGFMYMPSFITSCDDTYNFFSEMAVAYMSIKKCVLANRIAYTPPMTFTTFGKSDFVVTVNGIAFAKLGELIYVKANKREINHLSIPSHIKSLEEMRCFLSVMSLAYRDILS